MNISRQNAIRFRQNESKFIDIMWDVHVKNIRWNVDCNDMPWVEIQGEDVTNIILTFIQVGATADQIASLFQEYN